MLNLAIADGVELNTKRRSCKNWINCYFCLFVDSTPVC